MTPENRDRFPYRVTFQANDRTAAEYKRLAKQYGRQGYAWTSGWGDGGKLTFGFHDKARRCSFSLTPLLNHNLPMGISNGSQVCEPT
jgi:hypothetical protein